MTDRSIPAEVARLKRQLAQVQKGQRLAHGASIEGSAVEVRDGDGRLRTILGVQGDGTVGVQAVNGPPPPAPSAPIVGSVIGGVTASWDGQFADGAIIPMDWSRVEVHASTAPDFTPDPVTLQSTIETAQGGTVVVPCTSDVYVRLVARNTSGTASPPSGQAGPLGPTPVVATEILDGIVTEVKLADDAVTAAKIAAGAVGTTALHDGAVLAEKLADAAVQVGKIADNAVTGPAIASSAVTAGKIAANAVTAQTIQAGAVTSAAVAAGAITTDKLTVTGGANLLTDPSFEGAYTASCIAGISYASQDTTRGNGSPTSLKINAVSGTPAYRAVQLTLLPTLPGEQLFLGVDCYVSSDWVGAEVNFQVRWETDAGAILSYGKASATSPAREVWTRLTGTFTAPPSATKARIRVESGNATAGTVWWDNAVVRPVVGGTQIQDGAITTQKMVAGAIQTVQLDAGAVNADKIASGAVTTAKLAALAVTADKIDANAITASKIMAGAVDAVALAADAITGKTITGGTINGTTITGGLIRTATSGERITLNENGLNRIVVYDASGNAVGELSSRGTRMRGTSGALLIIDPSATYPQMSLYNATNTNWASVLIGEGTGGDANLELMGGGFAGSGYSKMRWHTVLGNDWAAIERYRADDPSHTRIGGQLYLTATRANIGFLDEDNPSKNNTLYVLEGFAQLAGGRMEILPPASNLPALHVNAASGHTGSLLRVLLNGGERFNVDKDGNTNIDGMLTAGNIAAGNVSITAGSGTPVSVSVGGLNLKGAVHVVATPATSVPGTQVTGVGVTNVTTSGFTVWLTRTGTATATRVNWMAYGI